MRLYFCIRGGGYSSADSFILSHRGRWLSKIPLISQEGAELRLKPRPVPQPPQMCFQKGTLLSLQEHTVDGVRHVLTLRHGEPQRPQVGMVVWVFSDCVQDLAMRKSAWGVWGPTWSGVSRPCVFIHAQDAHCVRAVPWRQFPAWPGRR